MSDLGLDDVPIVALNAQRAVYARAADAYLGPDARQCEALRERWGRALLLERSNCVVLDTSLTELALPLAAIAATQFWNPAGWIAAAIVAASAVGGWLTGKLAKLLRRKSRRTRDEEITRAIAESERTIREAFAELRPEATRQLVDGCRLQLRPKLGGLVAAARTLRLIVVAAEESARRLREASADIPVASARAQDAVRAAQSATAERLDCDAADLMLFERWLGAAKSVDGTPRRQAQMPR